MAEVSHKKRKHYTEAVIEEADPVVEEAVEKNKIKKHKQQESEEVAEPVTETKPKPVNNVLPYWNLID